MDLHMRRMGAVMGGVDSCCVVLCCMFYVGSWVALCCVVLCYIVGLGLGLELVSSLVQELFAVIAQPRPQP